MNDTADGAFAARINRYQQRIERTLDAYLREDQEVLSRLREAMRYSVLGGGKRLRPILVYLTGEAFGAQAELLDAPAAAVELIHGYSLIHDDLPAMDDDDLRRGRPSCHRAFDEGTAILAGDGLQALAFEVLAAPGLIEPDPVGASERVRMLATLAYAIGTEGMAGGQAIDLEATGKTLKPQQIERMHRRKTGALIQASIELGAIAAGQARTPSYQSLQRFGAEIGLAFQIQDDILDITGETHVIGKRQGADAALGKATYPSVFGLERSRDLARAHRDQALQELTALGSAAAHLRELAHFVVSRIH